MSGTSASEKVEKTLMTSILVLQFQPSQSKWKTKGFGQSSNRSIREVADVDISIGSCLPRMFWEWNLWQRSLLQTVCSRFDSLGLFPISKVIDEIKSDSKNELIIIPKNAFWEVIRELKRIVELRKYLHIRNCKLFEIATR